MVSNMHPWIAPCVTNRKLLFQTVHYADGLCQTKNAIDWILFPAISFSLHIEATLEDGVFIEASSLTGSFHPDVTSAARLVQIIVYADSINCMDTSFVSDEFSATLNFGLEAFCRYANYCINPCCEPADEEAFRMLSYGFTTFQFCPWCAKKIGLPSEETSGRFESLGSRI